jgi:predicted DNA repair protein MutK
VLLVLIGVALSFRGLSDLRKAVDDAKKAADEARDKSAGLTGDDVDIQAESVALAQAANELTTRRKT